MVEEWIKKELHGIDASKQEQLEKARRFLGDVPEGIRIDHNALTEWAKEYGISVCYPQSPVLLRDGWYMNMPDGTSYKISDLQSNPPDRRPRRYMMYEPGGGISSTELVPSYAIEEVGWICFCG